MVYILVIMVAFLVVSDCGCIFNDDKYSGRKMVQVDPEVSCTMYEVKASENEGEQTCLVMIKPQLASTIKALA